MDPEAALGILLHAIADYRDAQNAIDEAIENDTIHFGVVAARSRSIDDAQEENARDAAETAIESADSLISWLAKGGFAPNWSKAVADALESHGKGAGWIDV